MQLIIDGWRIDVSARTARRDGRTKQLSPRAIRLLQVFAEAGGGFALRADLLDRVWPNVTVGDESLTQVVSELRRTLGNRNLIVTVPRGGYRITAPVLREAGSEMDGPAPTPAPFTLDAYTLYIEAQDCFDRGAEGSQRAFVDLAAQAASLSPDFAEARALHATALLKRHIFWSEGEMCLEDALQEAAAALELCPTLAGAHFIDASIRIAIGLTEPGLRSLQRAISLAPMDAGLHLEAAILVLSMGNLRAAAALATKSAMLAPDHFGADLLAARLFMVSDPPRARVHAERALKTVRAVLEIDPHYLRALYALGPLLAQIGDHRAARSVLEGIAHHNSPLEYYRAIGFCLLGDSSAALERLDFLGLRGWRHACILDKENGFHPMLGDPKFERLRTDLLAA